MHESRTFKLKHFSTEGQPSIDKSMEEVKPLSWENQSLNEGVNHSCYKVSDFSNYHASDAKIKINHFAPGKLSSKKEVLLDWLKKLKLENFASKTQKRVFHNIFDILSRSKSQSKAKTHAKVSQFWVCFESFPKKQVNGAITL